MELEVLNSSDNSAEFIIKGERHTFPNLLREALLEDEKVSFAAYSLNHPMDHDCRFIVKTEGKQAKKALSDALKRIDEKLDEFKKEIKKAK